MDRVYTSTDANANVCNGDTVANTVAGDPNHGMKIYSYAEAEGLIWNRTANLEKMIQDLVRSRQELEVKHEKEIQGLTGMLVDRDETITAHRKDGTMLRGRIDGMKTALMLLASKGKRG